MNATTIFSRLAIVAMLAGLSAGLLPRALAAAEKYAVGEEVEVYFLNKWMAATVRESNKKGEVLCEFPFAGTTKLEIFPQEKVRHMYESGALARSRTWSDATGKYTVRAALLKISGGKVELRTTESKEVMIAIDKLSTKDQAYIKQFQSQAGLDAIPVPDLPDVVEFATAGAQTIAGGARRRNAFEDPQTLSTRLRLAADPIRKGMDIRQAGVGFPALSIHERLSSLIPLGGNDNWILASIGENARQPTRLMWVALDKNAVKRIQMLPAGEMLVDYHAASRQMLTYSTRSPDGLRAGEQRVLTVWQAEPATEEPKAVVSWNARLPDDRSGHRSVPWARFVSASQVVQRTETHRILNWDIAARRLAWQTAQESFFAPEPALSAGNKYLLLPEDGGLRILDSSSGALLGEVPMDGCSGVAAHEGGEKVAIINRSHIYVVDLTGQQSTQSVNANSVGSPFQVNLDWVGDELLSVENVSGGLVLFSMKLELPIWTYSFDSNAYWATTSDGARKRSIVNDHLVYAATFNVGGKDGLAVGAVSLPGERASQAILDARRADYMIIEPGARVRLDVSALDHASEIRQALMKEIAANAWVHDATSDVVVKAEYQRGETREVRYELQSTGRGGSTQIQSATVTPYVAKLQVMVGKDVAWSMISSSGPPPVVMLREGESLQSHVDRSNGPVWSFYQKLDIPAEIIDPKKQGGLGKTTVTNRGLIDAG